MPDDPEATRYRLAEARAQLALDPDNQELADRVRLLSHVVGCFEWRERMERGARRGRLIINAAMRRN
jgi:hypothetical protein